MSVPQFHTLTIKSVTRLTPDSVSLQFEIPEDLKEEFSFIPGQYLTLRKMIDGEEIRRSYSICSPLSQNTLSVGVKKVVDGTLSVPLQVAEPGDRIDVMPPQGRFTAPIGGTHSYLLLASGSGITPSLSIATCVLEDEEDSSITLIYGNRSTGTIMFRSEVDGLKDRYPDRFQLIHVLSRERTDMEFLNGRLDGAMLTQLIDRGVINPKDHDAAYLCGPHEMIEECNAALQGAGMAENTVHFELFYTDKPPKAPLAEAIVAIEGGSEVTIIADGSSRTINVDATAETVLSAAQRNGLDLPFSCAGGMCCTCRCKIIEGEAGMDANYSLQKWELEAGFTLACQTRPKGETLTLDFDAS